MTKDNRRIITWSLNATKSEYQDDLEKYSHKIYSIGCHEFGVNGEGKIYDQRTERNYFDGSGNHTGVRFPVIIENQMLQYPSIKWYLQMILFGWSKVKPVLDNNVVNSEGRFPQDQFVYELNKVLDLYEGSRNSGKPLGIQGIEMDVEASMTADYTSSGTDEKYIAFLEKVKNEVIIPRKIRMRVNAHAMWGQQTPFYYRFHNYKLFAESTDKNGNATIDEIQLMTYDFAWNGSSAGASTPIWWFQDVAEWCKDNFDPKRNPKAKLTMENLYFGAAGYGHRWGMHSQEEVKSGSTITFRNLLGWANGQYRHYHTEKDENGNTIYVYHDQEYLYQAAFQDEESKNEVMYPHVYDMFKPKYAKVKEQNGGSKTASVGTYNGNEYAASNFKQQVPAWKGVHAVANIPSRVSGKAFAMNPATEGLRDSDPQSYDKLREYDPILDPNDANFKHVVKSVGEETYPFVGYYTLNRRYYPSSDKTVCLFENESNGVIEYKVNVSTSKKYRVIALTSFSWYDQAQFGGTVNGASFSYGDDLPEWYPYFVKGSHWADIGSFDLNAGENTIQVLGASSKERTPIYGFVICDEFDANFSGGELAFGTNIQPMVKKGGSLAPVPKKLALAAKMLRRDSRPAILWDDEFRTYDEGLNLVTNTTYYRESESGYRLEGGGTNIGENSKGQAVCYSDPKPVGYSQGRWIQKNGKLYFNSKEDNVSSAQIVLSKQWSVNLSIEARIQIVEGAQAGIRFYAQTQGTVADGYIFRIDLRRNVRELVYENHETGEAKIVASQPLGNVQEGQTFVVKALLHNGVGQFFVGGVQAFVEGDNNQVTHDGSVNVKTGEVQLERTSGACGIYANNVELYCSHLGISTTDRWETLEKFEVTVDGETEEYGRIKRTGYDFDEFGYLIYSGLNEVETRDEGEETSVSLDYEITVIDWDSWEGAKDVTIKLRDAGVWFGELLVGDKEGMSIIWAGDAWSFLDAMNMAVSDYGAKGIGLWTMGQEDPHLFELVPDVVPKL